MVKLTKIYTRSGDDGTTGLGTGDRVPKHDLRVASYGSTDEANAALGLALLTLHQPNPSPLDTDTLDALATLIQSIQHDLFDLGADLCCPIGTTKDEPHALRINLAQTARLEAQIDRYNDQLEPLTSFILPGGCPLATHLHHARTVVRRAERLITQLHAQTPDTVNPETIRYINRLSDLLFVLARVANDFGQHDILWTPGKNRPHTPPSQDAQDSKQ